MHAKQVPPHGARMARWKRLSASADKYFQTYEGNVSSHDCVRADDRRLARIARQIAAAGPA